MRILKAQVKAIPKIRPRNCSPSNRRFRENLCWFKVNKNECLSLIISPKSWKMKVLINWLRLKLIMKPNLNKANNLGWLWVPQALPSNSIRSRWDRHPTVVPICHPKRLYPRTIQSNLRVSGQTIKKWHATSQMLKFSSRIRVKLPNTKEMTTELILSIY